MDDKPFHELINDLLGSLVDPDDNGDFGGDAYQLIGEDGNTLGYLSVDAQERIKGVEKQLRDMAAEWLEKLEEPPREEVITTASLVYHFMEHEKYSRMMLAQSLAVAISIIAKDSQK